MVTGKGHDEGATFYNPDGSIQQQVQSNTDTARPQPAKRHEEYQSVAKDIVGDLPPDMNPALLKRIADEAAKTADDKADDLADAIYEKFMKILKDRIVDNGGSLTMDDVDDMGQQFRDQLTEIKDTFLDAVESYTLSMKQNRVSTERGQIFKRLMVHHFEGRFANEQTLKTNPDFLSRRMLPGFYNALSMMLGPPKLERYEEQAKTLVERLRKETNGQIEWSDVYAAPEARRIALRAEIDIARHFKDIEKRLDWMIAMINSNMIPLEEGRVSSGWTFTKEAAEGMLRGLFQDLRSAMRNRAVRDRFKEEMGNDTVQLLESVTRRFA